MRRSYVFTTLLGVGAATGLAVAQDPPAEQVDLTGVVRDFIERTKEGGHPDFERRPDAGFGHYMGNIDTTLGPERKPVFVGGGNKVGRQWKTSAGWPIHPSLYDPDLGDVAGYYTTTDDGGIDSAESFAQWYRDVPGLNLSQPLTLTLDLVPESVGSGLPVYQYASTSFWPIDGQLFGNSGGSPDHNFHLTFELHCEFTYLEGTGQTFTFYGDDDVWVFINDQLVIDIGGVHSKVAQRVELDRLDLDDGKTYPLDFFFAERHRTQSNFMISTSLVLKNADLPTTSAAYD